MAYNMTTATSNDGYSTFFRYRTLAMASTRRRGRKLKSNDKKAEDDDSPSSTSCMHFSNNGRRRFESMGDNSEVTSTSSHREPFWNKDGGDSTSGFERIKVEVRPHSSSGQQQPICVVCGDVASGQYFGATVCLPCKSFYIRCTKEGNPYFTTRCIGTCDVKKHARIRCQSCRYQRCIDAGMSRKEKPERVDPEEGQYLCLVCGDIANGIHFGVFTCEGCKKFFRRGLMENKSYKCKGSSECLINPRSRNNCRACRYQKCIKVGMSREAIKMGRPKKRDTNHIRRSKMSSLPIFIEDSVDIILVNSNSDSEDGKMPETDVASPRSRSHSRSVRGMESPQSQHSSSSEETDARSPVKNLEKPNMSGTTYAPVSSPSSTLTSRSEYSEYGNQQRTHDVNRAETQGTPDVNEASSSSSQDDMYSMSTEDIDSMLQLLEDFESQKPSTTLRRKAVAPLEKDCSESKKSRLVQTCNSDGYSFHDSEERKGRSFPTSKDKSRMFWFDNSKQDNLQTDKTGLAHSHIKGSGFEESALVKTQTELSPFDSVASLFRYAGSSCHSEHPSMKEQCICNCWGRLQEADVTSSSSSNHGEKTSPDHSLSNPSIGEISRAFGVLYDKYGVSGGRETGCGDKPRGPGASSMESWWDIDVNCKCIQVSGGLCFCPHKKEDKQSEHPGYMDHPGSYSMSSILASLLREPRASHLSIKYRGQISELQENGPMTGIQGHLLHQFLEPYFKCLTGSESAQGDDNSAGTELISLMQV